VASEVWLRDNLPAPKTRFGSSAIRGRSLRLHPFIEPQAARAIRARVQVAAGGRDIAVPEGRLDLGQGGWPNLAQTLPSHPSL